MTTIKIKSQHNAKLLLDIPIGQWFYYTGFVYCRLAYNRFTTRIDCLQYMFGFNENALIVGLFPTTKVIPIEIDIVIADEYLK